MIEQRDGQYRGLADNCFRLAEFAVDEKARRRYLRMADAWLALAEEQDWLEGLPTGHLAAPQAEQVSAT